MADNVEKVADALPEEVKEKLNQCKTTLVQYGVWAVVIVMVIASLMLSYISLRRSTIDNESLRSINELSTRLDRAVTQLESLNEQNRFFMEQQAAQFKGKNTQDAFNYDALKNKYGDNSTSSADDLTSEWLFSEYGDIGSNKPAGNK